MKESGELSERKNLRFQPFDNFNYKLISKKSLPMSDNRYGLFRAPVEPAERTGQFAKAANLYSELGINCFNQCISPNQEVSSD